MPTSGIRAEGHPPEASSLDNSEYCGNCEKRGAVPVQGFSRTRELPRIGAVFFVGAGNIFSNRARLRYPKFRAQGLCTSTGIVEAGCKVAIGTRLKRLACTGSSMAQTPSSPCAAASPVDAMKTSGSADLPGALPESIPQT
jgi:hypothetical protein